LIAVCLPVQPIAFFLEIVKSYQKELWFDVPTRLTFINITQEVEKCLAESGIKEGLLLCNAMQI
jgi:thiamine phosphate synthase YjbQ (UPF0047 family)